MLYYESYLNTWTWICLLFVCGITCVFCILNDRRRIKRFFEGGVSENICTSLSCVRCSNSVFSPNKLLEKWSVIEKTLQLDNRLSHRIKTAISRDNSRCEISENQAPNVFYLEGVPAKVWYTSEDYTREVLILERKSILNDIVSEFNEIHQKLNVGWVSNKVPSGGWFLFYLINQGVRIEENCQRCPKTMNLIEELPLLMSDCAFGNVMFSVLLPGTQISRHCGPTNVRIRCHVPINIPDGYFINIAGEERTWEKDKVLIFDDSFYHEVYHRGDSLQSRIVLMIDFWHPCLNFQEKQAIKTLFLL